MRLFLAVDLPAELRSRLEGLQRELRSLLPQARWVRPEGIHLTLKFLGEVAPERVEELCRCVAEALPRLAPWEVEARGLGAFPSLQRPRVVWVGVEDPSGRLFELQRRLERGLVPLGFPLERGFVPHLTLARVKGSARALPPRADGFGRLRVEEVVLFRSELRPEGARYSRLRAFPLRSG